MGGRSHAEVTNITWPRTRRHSGNAKHVHTTAEDRGPRTEDVVWYTYGMVKTTIYLPDELKRQIERTAREKGRSEADVIRDAISAAIAPPAAQPRIPLVRSGLGDPSIASRVDELLDEFGP